MILNNNTYQEKTNRKSDDISRTFIVQKCIMMHAFDVRSSFYSFYQHIQINMFLQ